MVDALDECDREKDIQAILQLLSQLQELTSVHLRIFLISRLELAICLSLEEMKSGDHQDFILHEILKPVIEQDISLFLKHKLSAIRKNQRQPPQWRHHCTKTVCDVCSIIHFCCIDMPPAWRSPMRPGWNTHRDSYLSKWKCPWGNIYASTWSTAHQAKWTQEKVIDWRISKGYWHNHSSQDTTFNRLSFTFNWRPQKFDWS